MVIFHILGVVMVVFEYTDFDVRLSRESHYLDFIRGDVYRFESYCI